MAVAHVGKQVVEQADNILAVLAANILLPDGDVDCIFRKVLLLLSMSSM